MTLPSILWDALGKPDILVFPGYNGNPTPDNPHGLAKAWRERGPMALRDTMREGFRSGVTRFLVNRPVGASKSGPVSGSFWSATSPERREQMADVLAQLPGELIAYVGAVIGQRGRVEVSAEASRQIPMGPELIRDEWLSMIGHGFRSFAVDWAGRWPEQWSKTFEAARLLGVTMYGEPCPFDHPASYQHRWITTLDYIRWYRQRVGSVPRKPEGAEWICWPLATGKAATELRNSPAAMLEELAALKDGGWSLMYGAKS